MKKEGLTYEDVNVVEMPPAEMPAALAGDQIAGYVVAEPFGAIGVNIDKGHVLHIRMTFGLTPTAVYLY